MGSFVLSEGALSFERFPALRTHEVSLSPMGQLVFSDVMCGFEHFLALWAPEASLSFIRSSGMSIRPFVVSFELALHVEEFPASGALETSLVVFVDAFVVFAVSACRESFLAHFACERRLRSPLPPNCNYELWFLI